MSNQLNYLTKMETIAIMTDEDEGEKIEINETNYA